MNPKKLLLLVGTLCLVAPLQATERPNVLMILVDDLKPALGCYGDAHAITPNIDRLASRGTRFELAYCNQAVCAPSRFTLMLGSHSTSTGLYGLGSQLRQIVPHAVTMPQYFAKHGYRTESLGKVFHIGHGNHGDPTSFSVEHFHDKVIEYLDPASTDGGQLTREEAFFTNQRLGDIRSLPRGAAFEGPDVEDIAYADGRVAAEAVRRLAAAAKLRKKDGTPFFMVAGFARPHLPFSAPKRYWDKFDRNTLPLPKFESLPADSPSVAGKRGGEINNYKPVPTDAEIGLELKRELIHGYYASTSYVDAQIGKVLTALDELSLSENTIVVLWGDHGFHLGDLGIWTKHTNYEQANRIPIIFAGPGGITAGAATKQLAESVDIFPTLAQLAGLPDPSGPQPIDGVSLVPVLIDPTARVRDHAYHAYPKRKLGQAIRTERYRFVQWKEPSDPDDAADYELYDYAMDPLETRNVAADEPEIVEKLKAVLEEYPTAVGRGAPQTNAGSPQIRNREILIESVVKAVEDPQLKTHGVVVAQGGREHGYSLHFDQGVPMLDVRISGKVTRLEAESIESDTIQMSAYIGVTKLSLSVNGRTFTMSSPGLITTQPQDGQSVGEDTRTAAGNYQPPNRFNGNVIFQRVKTFKSKTGNRP